MSPKDLQELSGRLFVIEALLSRLMTDQFHQSGNIRLEMETVMDILRRGLVSLSPASAESAEQTLTRILQPAAENAEHLRQQS
jgi:hypothetical protein